tara:strand:+ start:6198 stop:7253 length:1056 start_codon:yes stop_codon:yes gene_type:complete
MNAFQQIKEKKVLNKDGKVDALGPYGRMKLTGREIATYFRKNKVKDKEIRKAVEVALDLGGADTIARKEIKKFYGDKILKSKEVQHALKYANEETFREDLQEISLDTNMLQRQFPNVWATKDSKLYRVLNSLISFHGYNDNVKAYKKNPKAFIDSLKKIAKNPSKHKELGRNFKQYVEKPKKGQAFAEAANPAQQAAIAISKKEKAGKPGYDKEGKSLKKEWKDAAGNNRRVHERDKRKEKKGNVMDSYRQMWEDGEKYAPQLDEKKEFKQSDIDKVAKLTDRNEHTKSLMHIAKTMNDKRSFKKLELIDKLHNEYGHLHSGLKSMRDEVYQDLKDGMKKYDNGQDMYGAT